MISETFNNFKVWAELLKKEEGIDYSDKNKDTIRLLADGYCLAKDTDDEHKKNLYMAGLMLRFWFVVNKIKLRSPIQELEYSDFVVWLYEAIEYACKYRAWQDPTKKVNAQQAINQCIETIRLQKYYGYNLQKNRANVNTLSLDAPFEEIDDSRGTILDLFVDEDYLAKQRYDEGSMGAINLIQNCINENKIVEAIILDTIAFNDTQRVKRTTVQGVDSEGNETKYTRYTSEFWPFKCVQLLSNLPEDYAEYFHKHYNIIDKDLSVALAAIKKATNQKLYKYLTSCLQSAKAIFTVA